MDNLSLESWMREPEGELALDIFRDGNHLVIRSPLAGVAIEDLDIAVHGDLLTIRGTRKLIDETRPEDWYTQECYWGSFSRSVVLPCDVFAEQAEASMRNGVLTVRIPMRHDVHRISIHPIHD